MTHNSNFYEIGVLTLLQIHLYKIKIRDGSMLNIFVRLIISILREILTNQGC